MRAVCLLREESSFAFSEDLPKVFLEKKIAQKVVQT